MTPSRYRPLRPDDGADCPGDRDAGAAGDTEGVGRDTAVCGLGLDDTLGGVNDRLGCGAGFGAEMLRGA